MAFLVPVFLVGDNHLWTSVVLDAGRKINTSEFHAGDSEMKP